MGKYLDQMANKFLTIILNTRFRSMTGTKGPMLILMFGVN